MSQSPSESDQPVTPGEPFSHRSWLARFGAAFRGVAQGIQGQSSFVVHLPVAAAVIAAAAVTRLPLVHWCLLLLCIGLVISLELLNSSLEWTCRGITDRYDERIRRGLDIASGAVLVAAMTAAVTGCLVFLDGLWISRG